MHICPEMPFAGSTAPLEVRVDLEPIKSSILLCTAATGGLGLAGFDLPSPEPPRRHRKEEAKEEEDVGGLGHVYD